MIMLKKIAIYTLSIPLWWLSSCIPKRRNLWLFSAWSGKTFADNSKYLYLYSKNKKNLTVYWITKSKTTYLKLKSMNLPVVHCYSLKGLITQLRAGAVFFTHYVSSDFWGATIGDRTKRFQLWHGTPLKKICHDDLSDTKYSLNLKKKLIKAIFPWTKEVFDFIPSTSEKVSTSLKSAFQTNNVFITGYPRNDVLKNSSGQEIKKAIYMPTFRGKNSTNQSNNLAHDLLSNYGFDTQKINHHLQKADVHLFLRLHPSNKLTECTKREVELASNIHIDTSEDIYEELDGYDLLISDYSSIIFDFLKTGKPIIFAHFDLNEYIENSRELYYDYSSIALNKQPRHWEDILAILDEFKSHGFKNEYQKKITELKDTFCTHTDSNSSQRVYQVACQLTGCQAQD